ncbi:MAG TPA: ABC transporter substrate-binding protein [Nitrososphaera sp.]|nr:ABC transporter substrate-binding protein [Nitrososphaera sp.]
MRKLGFHSYFVCAIIAILLSSALVENPAFSQAAKKGPFIDQARFIHRVDENLALEEVKSGFLDSYFFPIPQEAANNAKNDPRLKVYDKTAGSLGFLANPAPAADPSVLNPFQFKEVRYALNYLIDREFVVNEILKGYGNPLFDPFGVYSPEYLNIINTVESFGFRYNPSLASSMISEAMTGAGATNINGKWQFNGVPVIIKILIRQDDVKKESMGEMVASELEKIGFSVQRDYGDLNKANVVVYASDPKNMQWQLYTEEIGGTSAFVKYNPIVPAQMYAPWMSGMPGSQNPAYWNYQNDTLDEVTQRIAFFNFTSEEERNQLVNDAIKMGMQESVRVFVAQKTDSFVSSASVQGLVNDFGAGITSKYSLLNGRSGDSNSSLDIGVKQIHQGSWNAIAGLKDLYSRSVYFMIADPDTFRHPYTGEVISFRSPWTNVTTQGPLGKLDVPADTIKWNQTLQQWVQSGEGSSATSRVTFTPLYSNWHHGIPMDVSDMMYSDYFSYEWGTNTGPGDRTIDPEFTPVAAEALKLSKGTRYVSPDRIESYIDIWHYDEKEIADSGVFFVNEPWEITAASERIVLEGKLAYSRSDAQAKGVGWYDPIVREHADMIKAELQEMKNEQYIPAALKDIVSVQDAIRRYDASISWIENHGHAIISNGAYYLDNFNVAGGTITINAFRDASYPFEAGHWSNYETPRLADITSVDVPRIVAMGQPTPIKVNVEVAGEPSNNVTVNYFVSNKDGTVVTTGEAQQQGSQGQFNIDLTSEMTAKLSQGPNTIKIFAVSNEALRPDISSSTILAAPGVATAG